MIHAISRTSSHEPTIADTVAMAIAAVATPRASSCTGFHADSAPAAMPTAAAAIPDSSASSRQVAIEATSMPRSR